MRHYGGLDEDDKEDGDEDKATSGNIFHGKVNRQALALPSPQLINRGKARHCRSRRGLTSALLLILNCGGNRSHPPRTKEKFSWGQKRQLGNSQ